MEALESSTLVDNPWRRSTLVRLATSGLKSGFADKGTSRTLVGAIAGGNERTWTAALDFMLPKPDSDGQTARFSEPSLVQNTCSQRLYLTPVSIIAMKVKGLALQDAANAKRWFNNTGNIVSSILGA